MTSFPIRNSLIKAAFLASAAALLLPATAAQAVGSMAIKTVTNTRIYSYSVTLDSQPGHQIEAWSSSEWSSPTRIGSDVVPASGTVTIYFTSPQVNQESIELRDITDGTSVTVLALDLTPPSSPFDVQSDPNQPQLISGRAEPGTRIRIRDAMGSVVGTGLTDAAGNFQITLSSYVYGATYSVTAEDAAINTSVQQSFTIPFPSPIFTLATSFAATSVAPGGATQITILLQGNNTTPVTGLQLQDTVPSPLTLTGIASNSCTGGSASTNGNVFSLANGTAPVGGCTVVLDVVWPASNVCQPASVTNTLVPGTDLRFNPAGPQTPGPNASATLNCVPPVVPAPVSHFSLATSFAAASVAPGGATQLTVQVIGDNTADVTGMQLRDLVPAPLTLTSVASNTCVGGTVDSSNNTLSLTDGVAPAGGCSVVLNVQWPASNACQPANVVNTVVPGTDLRFTSAGPVTGGANATATLSCVAAPVVDPRTNTDSAPVPVPVGGVWFFFFASLATLGIAGRKRFLAPQR